MVSKKSRSEVRVNKHRKLRNRFSGTAERPRLAVFRSNNHMYAPVSYTHLKTKRRGMTFGKTAKTKKAIVQLTADSADIEIFEGL